MTGHAAKRLQQRGLPPLVLDWLTAYGQEHHDGHGATILYFNKPARRRLERAVGRLPLRRMADWLNAYAVISTDGALITAGHRYRRIPRQAATMIQVTGEGTARELTIGTSNMSNILRTRKKWSDDCKPGKPIYVIGQAPPPRKQRTVEPNRRATPPVAGESQDRHQVNTVREILS
jgi:hypothetical protein